MRGFFLSANPIASFHPQHLSYVSFHFSLGVVAPWAEKMFSFLWVMVPQTEKKMVSIMHYSVKVYPQNRQ